MKKRERIMKADGNKRNGEKKEIEKIYMRKKYLNRTKRRENRTI